MRLYNIKWKQLLSFIFSIFLTIFLFLPNFVTATAADPYGIDEISTLNLGKEGNVKNIIASIINIALGFLGVIAVIIILFAGFKWMTASGNEEQVASARKMLVQAITGLVIVFLAWIIANFIIDQLKEATNV